MLASELQGLIDLDFDVELTGFDLAEIDLVLDDSADANPAKRDVAEDVQPSAPPYAVTAKVDMVVRRAMHNSAKANRAIQTAGQNLSKIPLLCRRRRKLIISCANS